MSAEYWVVIISTEPEEPDSREMLELVLAGATLELPLVVVFLQAGSRHLIEPAFTPFRQLVDFELARLRACEPVSEVLPAGVSAMDRDELERCCDQAAGVLWL